MSNKFSSLAVVAAFLALPMSQLFAQGGVRMGARIVLLLHNQPEIAGRLLSVRDSALVISTNKAPAHHINAQTAGISVVKNQNIRRVIIKGESRVLEGMVLGLLIGAGTGVMIGVAAGDDEPCPNHSSGGPLEPGSGWCLSFTAGEKALAAGIVLGAVGLGVGAKVGDATSKADKTIYPPMSQDFSALKSLAQFPQEEPEYLSLIK